jgi:hypothetical protein
MLTARDYIKALLLDLAWFEAAPFGGLKPMQMVAQCVANRARTGWGDWSFVLSTVYQPGKHARSAAQISDMLLARRHPDTSDPRFTRMLGAIDAIYDNTFENLVSVENEVGVYWADLTWLPGHPGFMKLIQDPEHVRTAQSGTFCTWS